MANFRLPVVRCTLVVTVCLLAQSGHSLLLVSRQYSGQLSRPSSVYTSVGATDQTTELLPVTFHASKARVGEFRTDNFATANVKIPNAEDFTYLVTGETTSGTEFAIRLSYTRANYNASYELKYAFPILSTSFQSDFQLCWTDGPDLTEECGGDINNIPDLELWDCLRKYVKGGYHTNEFCSNDNVCKPEDDPLPNKDATSRVQKLTPREYHHYNTTGKIKEYLGYKENYHYVIPKSGGCLGNSHQTWWKKRLLNGEYRQGHFQANVLDHKTTQNCGTGSCTPQAIARSHFQEWVVGGINTVVIAELVEDFTDFELQVSPEYGAAFETCYITPNSNTCDFGEDASITFTKAVRPSRKGIYAIMLNCGTATCTLHDVARWVYDGNLDDEWPILKWQGMPGPGCAKLGSDTWFSPPYYLKSHDAFETNHEGLRFGNDKTSDGDCGWDRTRILQTAEQLLDGITTLDDCKPRSITYPPLTTVHRPVSENYACDPNQYVENGGYYSQPFQAEFYECDGVENEFRIRIATGEIIVTDPPGVDISLCEYSITGFYGIEEGVTLKLSGCRPLADPYNDYEFIKLNIITIGPSFAGGLTSRQTTYSTVDTNSILMNMPDALNALIIEEQYSQTRLTIDATNILSGDDIFGPGVDNNSSGGDGGFWHTVFGRFFSILLICIAIVLLFMAFSGCLKIYADRSVKIKSD